MRYIKKKIRVKPTIRKQGIIPTYVKGHTRTIYVPIKRGETKKKRRSRLYGYH